MKIMKNNYKKILLSIIALTVSFASFAQLPDPGDGGGPGGGPPDPAAPINNELIWLAVAGLFFAYFIFSTRNKKA